MPGVADELSDLADATLEAALAIARAKVGEERLQTRLAVVGLGKCGAQELNYVSDVDVLFVAEPALDEDGEPLISNDAAITTATRMAAELTRICSAHTKAGTIWEVDAALRPEGKAGQLVRTLASHQTYYEKWAKTWEFQAMLKARPSAGDLELGQAFVDMVAPMVWAAAERENFVSDTQAMRKRVVAHIPARDAGREIKLGEGGLRDVEFSVQLLQLVHGRADERLRLRATLEALRHWSTTVTWAARTARASDWRTVPAHPGAPDPAVPAPPYPRAAGRRGGPAPDRPIARLRRPGHRAARASGGTLLAVGPPAARAAVLLPAAGRGGPDPDAASSGSPPTRPRSA